MPMSVARELWRFTADLRGDLRSGVVGWGELPRRGTKESEKVMSDDRSEEQPLDRMIEQPDLQALREAYKGPSRSRLRFERFLGALRRAFTDRTVLTIIMAIAIVIVLVVGYIQLS